MSTIDYPTDPLYSPAALEWGLDDNVLVTRSPLNGATQTLEIPGARWWAIVTLRNAMRDEIPGREAFVLSLRSGINRLAMWHLGRPFPRGTMRGTPTLSSSVAVGQSTLPITTLAGRTMLAGDMVKVGSQLFMASANATADGAGALSLPVLPKVRTALSNGASVTWDRPTALFLLTAPVRTRYVPGYGPEIQLQLSEVFE